MNPKETIKHIAELAAEAQNNPTWLTFQTIHEWCEKQMDAYDNGLSDKSPNQAPNKFSVTSFPAITTHSDKIIVLEDGYNGRKCAFFYEPIERDGDLVRLRCAESGKEYMTAWRHESVLRTERDPQDQLS